MPFDSSQRRAALVRFRKEARLKNLPWCSEAGLAEATVRNFIKGRTHTLSDETYELLADAASTLLDRKITATELRGDPPNTVEIAVNSYVGAGDEVHLIDGDSAIDYIPAPPGYEKGGAAVVRGDSMRPTFDDGDVLFYKTRIAPPAEPSRRPVIVHVKDGPLLVKRLLPGSRKGRFHLLSVNPVTPTLIDQPIESIARIGWVKPVE